MSHLSVSDVHALARLMQRHRFVAGEDIVRQGDFTNRFFIVDEGYVHFRKTDIEGFEHPLGSRGPGEHFGLQMFTSQEPSEYTAEAIGAAVLYVLECDDFERLVQANPGLIHRLPQVELERRRLTHGFKWLTPGEVVALTTHRHGFSLFTVLLAPVLLALLGVGLVVVLEITGLIGRIGLSGFEPGVIGILLLLTFLWGLYSTLNWSDDDFIVTNKRIVHSEKMVFMSEVRNEIPIDKIQSITVLKPSVIQTALGIGTIDIRSAGKEEGRIAFDHVGNVERIRQVIEQQRGNLRALHRAEDRERFRRRMGNELQHYVFQRTLEETPNGVAAGGPNGLRARFRVARHNWFGTEFREGNTITWRKHWIALAKQAGAPLLALFILVIALIAYLNVPILRLVPAQGFYAVWFVLVLLAIGFLLWQWEDWRNDIYQVTENSIVDIERLPFGLDSRETTALLVNVQDAKVLRPSLLHGILNYGEVEIQTAGGGAPLVFYNVARPQDIANELFRRLETFRLRQRERDTMQQSQNIVDALVAYHRLLMQERHGEGGEAVPAPSGPALPPPGQEIVPPLPPPAPPGPVTVIPQEDLNPATEFPPAEAFE